MSLPLTYSLIAVFASSIIALIGIVFISTQKSFFQKNIHLLVALAVGALLGDAFFHLIPESFELNSPESAALFILIGMGIFFVLEKFFRWHHHAHDEFEGHDCPPDSIIERKNRGPRPLGKIAIASDSLHNFLDGAIIAGSFLISFEVGVATTIAVILHEIPQEVGDYAVLLHSGYTKMKALFWNFVSALLAFAGVFIVFFSGQTDSVQKFLMPIAAGTFIYLASSDLIPELHKEKGLIRAVLEFIALIVGILLMYLLLFLE